MANVPAITLIQPWATACVTTRDVDGFAQPMKVHETRHWPINYRGPIAIHAGKNWSRDYREHSFHWYATAQTYGYVFPKPEDLPRGAVVGIGWVDDCQPVENLRHRLSDTDYLLGNYDDGRYAWHFDPTRLEIFETPVPANGKQGIWTWER